MVALTSTLLSAMGSKLVLPQTGVLMNNGVMWFDPRPGRPNSISPGRRPLTNMCPVILREGGAPVLAAGASGGRRILGAVLQMLAFVGDFGMDPEAAAQHPRIDVSGPDLILADRRFDADVLAALAAAGPVLTAEHAVQPINFACPNLILARPDGERVGITDALSPWSAALAQADG
jgi:gamma-glutamyltranspeptidase/glutathione hydrolase